MAEEGDASGKKNEWITEQFCSVIIVKHTKRRTLESKKMQVIRDNKKNEKTSKNFQKRY